MTAWDAVKNRRSITSYKDIPISQEQWCKLITAASLAPNAGNIQDWRFVVITEQEKRKAIAQACHEQNWMATAPLHIVCCADTKRAKRYYGVRGERLYSTQNLAAAIENMLIVATEMGLGSNWVGSFEEEQLRTALGIPEDIRPQAIATFGYPNEVRPTPQRQPLEWFVFQERWGNKMRLGEMNLMMHDYSKYHQLKAKQAGGFIASIFKRLFNK